MQSQYTPNIPAASGIYRITCTITGKFYIGSSVNLYHRRVCHFSDLRNGIHKNAKLQAAWNKYGATTFIFEVLELILPDIQIEREQYWLDKLKPFGKKGFNISREAGKPSSSPETNEKIRLAQLGHILSAEGRAKMIASKTGHTYTPEIYKSRMKTLIVISPKGETFIIHGIRQFCREHNLNASHLLQVAKGKERQHKGWTVPFPDASGL